MSSLKDIRKRIASVKNTQKITRAMKLVAAAKLKRSQDAAIRARDYANEMEELVYRASRSVGAEAPELMRRHYRAGSLDLLVIASDRGLCGGFNEILFRRVDEIMTMHQRHGIDIKLFVYGRKGINACEKRKICIAQAEEVGGEMANAEWVRGIAQTLVRRFLDGHADGSFIAYNYFKSAVTQQVLFKDLLPFHQRRKDRRYQVEYLYEPSRAAILDELVQSALVALIMQAFRESHVSELAARMMAMNAATKNGDDMIEHLTMMYHRARQAAITRELMDIVNGAEALAH